MTASEGDAVLFRSTAYAKYCNGIFCSDHSDLNKTILFRIEQGTRW